MTQLSCDLITLGADVGGKDAFNATHQHILALRNLLRKIDTSTTNGALKEIALVLRVDGSVQAWGKRGVDNISFLKKKSFVTVDIFVTTDIWLEGDPHSDSKLSFGSSEISSTASIGLRESAWGYFG